MGIGIAIVDGKITFTALAGGVTQNFGSGRIGQIKAFAFLAEEKSKLMESTRNAANNAKMGAKVLEAQFSDNEPLIKEFLATDAITILPTVDRYSFAVSDEKKNELFVSASFLEVIKWLRQPRPSLARTYKY